MLALCWPEAMLQAESQRSMASLGKSGSVAPALQRGKAPSWGLSQDNCPDSIWISPGFLQFATIGSKRISSGKREEKQCFTLSS
jgi:hypothetical protein